MTASFNIAVIPGDGIGREVMPEGLRVLNSAAEQFGIRLKYTHIAWASCDYYASTGRMMPEDWKAQLAGMDAIYFGAVGWPAAVPDHICTRCHRGCNRGCTSKGATHPGPGWQRLDDRDGRSHRGPHCACALI